MMLRSLLAAFALVFAAALLLQPVAPSQASVIEPEEMLEDPVQEARARDLFKELRCVVCQNQSLDESNAGLAADMRGIIRERILAGASDEEIRAYLVGRYGDYVLMNPPVKPTTYILWYGPGAIALLGVLAVAVYFRRRRAEPRRAEEELSEAEHARLHHLLEPEDGDETRV